ncbi:MAG: DUF4956 domain-containing protein [Anaerolineae bacterium]
MDNFTTVGFSFLLNSLVAFLIIRAIYYPVKRDKEYVLTFLTFNTLIFLIAHLLQGVNVTIGLGLSMFAIFRMLRYRTDPIPIREMTYLFVMMALPFVNATLVAQENYAGLLIADALVIAVLLLVEKGWGFQYVGHKTITYERIDLIKPENYEALLADLRARTGLDITRCEVGKLDFLRDVAEIKIDYIEPRMQTKAAQSRKKGTPYKALFEQEWRVAPDTQFTKH